MMLQESLVDVEDVVSCIVVSNGDGHDDVVDRWLCGWMFVATIDKLLGEQVHVVVVADDCQILFSLLLLHFRNLHLLLSLTPPKLLELC